MNFHFFPTLRFVLFPETSLKFAKNLEKLGIAYSDNGMVVRIKRMRDFNNWIMLIFILNI